MSVIEISVWKNRFAAAASIEKDEEIKRSARAVLSHPDKTAAILSTIDINEIKKFFSIIYDLVKEQAGYTESAFNVAARSHLPEGARVIYAIAQMNRGCDMKAIEAIRENGCADVATSRMGMLASSTSDWNVPPKVLEYALEIQGRYNSIRFADVETTRQKSEIAKDVEWIRHIAEGAYQRRKYDRQAAPG